MGRHDRARRAGDWLARRSPLALAAVQCALLVAIGVAGWIALALRSEAAHALVSTLFAVAYGGYWAWAAALCCATGTLPRAWLVPLWIAAGVFALLPAALFALPLAARGLRFAGIVTTFGLQLAQLAVLAPLARTLARRAGFLGALAALAWWILLALGFVLPGAPAVIRARLGPELEQRGAA
jgi:hypothetical protein